MDTATIPGNVYLVGAGPGDPDLLTVKAARLIGKAEAVVYDRLVSDEVMRLANPNSLRVSVGKSPKCHPVPQERINEILIDLALLGRMTVRLKGGDPFIFGRGSEEALALRRAGIRCEIVPGITAAQGCSASTGVPLTHRGLATGVRLITGHCRQDQPLDLDWRGLADRNTTLVVYMGAANIAEIAARLMAEGLAGSTLVLTVNNGTTPRERRILADLQSIAGIVERAKLEGPVLFFIGNVVSLYQGAGIFPVMRETWPCLPAIAELSGYA
jgi:uroporphyrin-III C-methyltransferase